MKEAPATVVVIDDDPGVREAIESFLQSAGLPVASYGSVSAFAASAKLADPACLVLDVRLPGQSGLDFRGEMARAGVHPPVIFITAHGDIQMSMRAMKAGAAEFLTKPFREQEVMGRVVAGRPNKQIAGDLDVSEITIKAHRAQVMRKMGARSVAELVRMADKLAAGCWASRKADTKASGACTLSCRCSIR
ncbi:MAG: two component transcriptional regulator, LuxR family [Caulobacteraceae bacterium]|nr:two component transcriptional regulator, LuxR family [Caulobacteraceae bacterium]